MEIEHSTHRAAERPTADLPGADPPVRLQFSLRQLLIGVLLVCLLLGALASSARYLRRSARRMECQNNLKQIALALHNYRDVYKAFPPAINYAADGTPMHSWRVAIAPFLVQNAFYDAYDYGEAWDGPSNLLLADELPEVPISTVGRKYAGVVFDAAYFGYRCPSAPRSQDRWMTNYVMLIDDRPGKPNGPPHRPGSVPPSLEPKSAVVIIEIAESDIRWMEPRDVLLSELSMKINDRSNRSLSSHHGGACVAYADGSVEWLDDATTEERVRALLSR
jgi:hypothetical protein